MTAKSQRMIDEGYMRTAPRSRSTDRSVSPNPRVGCVIVRDNEVIGSMAQMLRRSPCRGRSGKERRRRRQGATVYVNLEPCCHQGRTPHARRCSSRRGIESRRWHDRPQPQGELRRHKPAHGRGIEVTTGILEGIKWINRGFIRRMNDGRPG